MANSTTNLDLISGSQAQTAVTANELLDALSPSSLFARRAQTTAALTWGFYGGTILVDGALTQVYMPDGGTVALTASITQYIEASRAGVITASATLTPGKTVQHVVTAGASTITSYLDLRVPFESTGRFVKAMADANYTLLHDEARCQILKFTGTLTAQRNIVVPLAVHQWTVYNAATDGLQFIGASGTGIVVATTKHAIIYADGTNVERVTADT